MKKYDFLGWEPNPIARPLDDRSTHVQYNSAPPTLDLCWKLTKKNGDAVVRALHTVNDIMWYIARDFGTDIDTVSKLLCNLAVVLYFAV